METAVQESKKAKKRHEFEDRLDILRNEIVKAELCFYSFIAMNNFLSDHKAEGNKNPLLWSTIKDALLETFFVTIGRIFDEDKKAHSVFSFVRFCKVYNSIFSKKHLQERKKSELTPSDLESYMKGIPNVTVSKDDFEKIETGIAENYLVYHEKYKNIRDKIFAHRDLKTVSRESDLYSKAFIDELEELLNFLNKVAQVFWELYMNGTKIDFKKVKYESSKTIITKDVEELLKRLSMKVET
jgi:AbiU2